MKPQIFEPAASLQSVVQCYWNLEGDPTTTPVRNTIVPDGTMKLIFHYADTYRHHPPKGKSVVLPHCFLIGQLTRPYVVEPLGITGSFVVRFHPNGFLPFSNLPVKAWENTAVPLEVLFGSKGTEIGQRVLGAADTGERIRIIESFLMEQLAGKPECDAVVAKTLETMVETRGNTSVDAFSRQLNIHRRQLTRKISSATGLSTKQLSKTIRMQTALKTLLTTDVTSLTAVAYDNDYFDQSHFIREFKAFTGITPKDFHGETLKMSLIFDRKA